MGRSTERAAGADAPPARRSAAAPARLAALLLALLAAAASGATVHLKDGRTVEGEIVKRTATEIRVRTANGLLRTIRTADVERIDEDPPPGAKPPDPPRFGTRDPAIDERTKEYERMLGAELRTAPIEHVVVRGDHEFQELARMADAVERTLAHFLQVFGAQPEEVLRARLGGAAPRLEVFEFKTEKGYLEFMDRVFDRLRDETVSKERFALMRRQRGCFVLSPRPVLVQFQGPSDFLTPLAAAVHKTSHALMLLWRPAGTWMPWWFLEGLGAWQEQAVLGECRTYCIEVALPGEYARPGTPEADEAAKARTERVWREKVKKLVSTRAERDLAVLGRMTLNELVFEDVLQSWSVVDWLHRTGKLRDFAAAYKELRELSPACEKVLGVPPAGAHERWRAWVFANY